MARLYGEVKQEIVTSTLVDVFSVIPVCQVKEEIVDEDLLEKGDNQVPDCGNSEQESYEKKYEDRESMTFLYDYQVKNERIDDNMDEASFRKTDQSPGVENTEPHQFDYFVKEETTCVPGDCSKVTNAKCSNLLPFKCPLCPKRCLRAVNLKLHMRTHFTKPGFTDDQKKIYSNIRKERKSCPIGDYFRKSQAYTRKMNRWNPRGSHTPTVRCPLLLCPKSFLTPDKMRRHIRKKHIDWQPLKCSLCPESYALDIMLQNHLQSHTKKESEDDS